MALTGLDYYSAAISQPVFDPSFIVMDRNSIDLNKHAFDLNEVPANDAGSSSQENFNGWVPKKGGWLELFCNMFAPENCVIGKAQLPCNPIPWNPNNSVNPQLDQRTQSDVKIFSAPYLNDISGIHGCQDRYRHNAVDCGTFPSLSELRKSNGTWEPPLPNTGNIFHVPILPITDPMIASPYAAKPLNGGARPKVRHPLYRGRRPPTVVTDVLQDPIRRAAGNAEFIHSVPQPPVHDSNHLKQGPRDWDLNTSPISETKDNLPAAGFPSPLCSVYNHGQSGKGTRTQAVRNDKEQSLFPQPFSKEFQSKFVKSENDSGSTASGQKSDNFENLPSTSNDCRKDSEPRVRIVASPDWLPPGWITELKTRKAGNTAGCTDKYYKDPVTGHRFRSKNEVMSFLQTGQTCRYKNQGKNTVLPLPELGTGSLNFLLPVENKYLPPPNGSTHYISTSADGPLSERIIVKQEPNEISQTTFTEHSDHRLMEFPFPVERSHDFGLQSRAPPDHFCKEKCDFSVQCNNKRKLVNDMSDDLLPKRTCFQLEQGEPASSSSPNVMKEEITTDTRVMHGSFCGLLFNMGQNGQNIGENGPQGKRMYQSLLTRYMSNECAHSSLRRKPACNVSQNKNGHIKEAHLPKGHQTKCSEKKVPKLTLKQERELLISLGRKLCQEFLTSIKKVNEPQAITYEM